ncbi:hypothetical protein KCU61_g85, partial [Aureobasidium melanogenum]
MYVFDEVNKPIRFSALVLLNTLLFTSVLRHLKTDLVDTVISVDCLLEVSTSTCRSSYASRLPRALVRSFLAEQVSSFDHQVL